MIQNTIQKIMLFVCKLHLNGSLIVSGFGHECDWLTCLVWGILEVLGVPCVPLRKLVVPESLCSFAF